MAHYIRFCHTNYRYQNMDNIGQFSLCLGAYSSVMIFPCNLGKYKIQIGGIFFTVLLQSSYISIYRPFRGHIHIITIHLPSYYKYAYSPITILLVLQLLFSPVSARSASDMEYYESSG
jgi:hypothetical protein